MDEIEQLRLTLLGTFDNPEINFVTFKRNGDVWDMRRFTREPTHKIEEAGLRGFNEAKRAALREIMAIEPDEEAAGGVATWGDFLQIAEGVLSTLQPKDAPQ